MADGDDNDTLLGTGGIDRIRRLFPDDGQVTVERELWDSVAMEPARLSGTKIRFHSLRRAQNHHPLYREPSSNNGDWVYQGPWEVWAALEFNQADEITPAVRAEGYQSESESILWIARREFEDAEAPQPKVGDVIDFWDENPWVSRRPGTREDLRYWDVVKANPSGNIFSSEVFVQWKITLKRRTSFNPGRKIDAGT